jgi:FMN phosphatase YigB (HAD superfamily)/sugar phosphate isomerase/epimerase
MTNQIEAILFDVDGTLRRTTKRNEHDKVQKVNHILALLGSDADPVEFSQLLSERQKAYKHWAENALIGLSEAELWKRWMLPDWPADQVGRQAIQFNQIWRDAIGKRVYFPETKEVLLALYRRGYRLGLVSNTTSSTDAPLALKEWGISGCFETIVLSCMVGKLKPDPAILLDATERMHIRPEKCAYVGNRPENDVISSRKAGFSKTVILRDPSKPLTRLDDPCLVPDHFIDNLTELLEIFPRRLEKKGKKPEGEYPIYDASISTMWAFKNFPTLNDFFAATRRLRFSKIELNHQTNSAMLAGIDLKQVQFSSVHEPCPADISVETLKDRDWLISAQDEENRKQGVAAVKRSIDLARQLGARAVVIHAGTTQSDRSLENKIRKLYETGQDRSEEYKAIKESMGKTRKDFAGPRFEAVKRSIKELLEYAGHAGILLGLENRYYYMEFPSPDELGLLLELAEPEQLGFVYDVGHAQAMDRLGFYPHEEWLQRYSNRMIGVHLHDVIGIADHYAPGLGEVDFDSLAAYLPADAFRTCELQVVNTTEQVKAGLKFLAEHGCVKCL